MKTYWLHIVESKSPQLGTPSTYILARAISPDRNGTGGAMPTVHHHSWERLAARLFDVGIGGHLLNEAKAELDKKGSHVIPEVVLSDHQLKSLGFEDVAA